ERESSLSFASSLFKKSFTLIELSIVLLILSLLVGSLLVGRQIVDRAKIQRIIFEFDYYEKAFHQFYDTYRVVPGNLDEQTCMKHAEFIKDGTRYCTWQQNASSSLVTKMRDKKLNGSYNSLRPYTSSMKLLYLAGLIEKWEGYGFANTENDLIPIVYNNGNVYLNTFSYMHALFPSSSYDRQIYISYLGWKKVTGNMGHDGMQRYLNYNTDNELFNNNFFSNLKEHNTIMFKYLEGTTGSGEARRTSAKAAMDAKLTSELDAKIDDGRPGSGRFLAFKNVNDPKYCYDKIAAEAHRAIYNSTSDSKYGCNILYVMEDVK
ncbi:MAG: hypothetical protein IJ590_04765, partial [Rickettsiales bacterium]|nr:hypothetical protein [Rickettsiales bacterium]